MAWECCKCRESNKYTGRRIHQNSCLSNQPTPNKSSRVYPSILIYLKGEPMGDSIGGNEGLLSSSSILFSSSFSSSDVLS